MDSWKPEGLCSTRPQWRCGKCKLFSQPGQLPEAAICACEDPNFVELTQAEWTRVWYPHRGEWKSGFQARQICEVCPSREACLAFGLETDDLLTDHRNPPGIFGGLAGRQREHYRAGRDPWVVCSACGRRVPRHHVAQTLCRQCQEPGEVLPPETAISCMEPSSDVDATAVQRCSDVAATQPAKQCAWCEGPSEEEYCSGRCRNAAAALRWSRKPVWRRLCKWPRCTQMVETADGRRHFCSDAHAELYVTRSRELSARS